MGLLSKGIKLSYFNVAFVELTDLQEIPELGAIAEKIEVTTLSDASKTYINGLKDYGDLEFKFLYSNATATDSFRVLTGLEASAADTQFQIELPDGATFTFNGQVSVRLDSVGVNAPLTFTAGIALSTDIVIANPA